MREGLAMKTAKVPHLSSQQGSYGTSAGRDRDLHPPGKLSEFWSTVRGRTEWHVRVFPIPG